MTTRSVYSLLYSGNPPRAPKPIGEAELHEITESFYLFDSGGKGYLTRQELKISMLSLLGYKPSKVELDLLLPKLHSTGMVIDQFTQLMSQKLGSKDVEDEIRQIFIALSSSCTGFITLTDFKKAFTEVAPLYSTGFIEQIFAEIDQDKDGRITFREFERLMKA